MAQVAHLVLLVFKFISIWIYFLLFHQFWFIVSLFTSLKKELSSQAPGMQLTTKLVTEIPMTHKEHCLVFLVGDFWFLGRRIKWLCAKLQSRPGKQSGLGSYSRPSCIPDPISLASVGRPAVFITFACLLHTLFLRIKIPSYDGKSCMTQNI